jgi:hypothetical protein
LFISQNAKKSFSLDLLTILSTKLLHPSFHLLIPIVTQYEDLAIVLSIRASKALPVAIKSISLSRRKIYIQLNLELVLFSPTFYKGMDALYAGASFLSMCFKELICLLAPVATLSPPALLSSLHDLVVLFVPCWCAVL